MSDIEHKLERIVDKLDDLRGDVHIIDKNLEVYTTKVDNHIQEEADTIKELRGLALIAPALKSMIDDHQTKEILVSERSRKRSELFKKARLYSAIGGAATTLFTAIYYGLKVKGLL